MNARHALLPALASVLLLSACGYGWQDPPRVYPPSGASRSKVEGPTGQGAGLGANDYAVQPGDTLYAIGFRNQIDWKDLAAWNGIGADNKIRAGQVLKLAPPDDDSIRTQPLATTPVPVAAPSDVPPGPVAIPPGQPTVVVMPTPVPVPPALPGRPPVTAPPLPAVTTPAVPTMTPVGSASTLRWGWPAGGKVVRAYNIASGAKGIDIAGELGQPVTASGAGKVVYSGSALKGYGELVIIKHDDTYLSAYGYNRKRLVKEGDEVRAGQTIAELGIGPEQKPVLHFEIREHGKPVDPMKYLPAH